MFMDTEGEGSAVGLCTCDEMAQDSHLPSSFQDYTWASLSGYLHRVRWFHPFSHKCVKLLDLPLEQSFQSTALIMSPLNSDNSSMSPCLMNWILMPCPGVFIPPNKACSLVTQDCHVYTLHSGHTALPVLGPQTLGLCLCSCCLLRMHAFPSSPVPIRLRGGLQVAESPSPFSKMTGFIFLNMVSWFLPFC